MKYLTASDGVQICYDVSEKNKDACLVLLHGLGGDLTAWDDERRHFNKEGVSSIAIDLRGHGNSGRPLNEEDYKVERFAKDVLEVIQKENFSDYAVVGHCFGGMVSLVLNAEHPKASRNLTLVDTSFKPPKFVEPIKNHPFLEKMLKLLIEVTPNIHIKGHIDFDKYIGTGDFDFERILSDILHSSLRSYLIMCETLVGYNASRLLQKILTPTLVIDGEKDTFFPPDVAKELQSRIKKSELDLIPGANHILVISDPKDLCEEIDKFLLKQGFI